MFDLRVKIGIWGFGVVGESLVRYLSQKNFNNLLVYDIKPVDCSLFKSKFIFTNDLNYFLETADVIFPSPGVDLDLYQAYRAKFVSELDLFAQDWHRPILAITGTLGKTTLTSLLENLLNQTGIKAVAAGNIGLPMLDIINQNYEQVVLELSSFQLDLCQAFKPDFAIWTNFYPNHLDRHKTLENYFLAKSKIFLNQTTDQVTLLPVSLIPDLIKFNLKIKSKLYFFGLSAELDQVNLDYIGCNSLGVFVLKDQQVVLQIKSNQIQIGDLAIFSMINTYQINLVILLAIIYLQKIVLSKKLEFKAIEHRLELFDNAKGVAWYNDSKSTVPQATLAAVQKLAGRRIVLFLGGVSKGVDRTNLILALKNKVKLIICFGAEANYLYQICLNLQIDAMQFVDLESAVNYCWQSVRSGDQVLFSPAGASFDLFKNYIERGNVFKKLVLTQYR